MVTLAHLQKYITEHRDHFPKNGEDIIERAEEIAATEGRTISSGHVTELLGTDHAEELFTLMGMDIDYIRISAEACSQESKEWRLP